LREYDKYVKQIGENQ